MVQEFRARVTHGNQPLPLKEYTEVLQQPQHLDLPNPGLQIQEVATRLGAQQLLVAEATRLEVPQLLVEADTEPVVLLLLVVVQETEEAIQEVD